MFAITWDGAAFSTVILRLVRNYALERAIQNCRDISVEPISPGVRHCELREIIQSRRESRTGLLHRIRLRPKAGFGGQEGSSQ